MPRLVEPRKSKLLSVRDLDVPYSFWPARKTKRWRLQRRLYVRDPWPILFEAVYRSDLGKKTIDEALFYLEQAEDFLAASQSAPVNVKPVLLYYSMLNLAKCLLIVRKPALSLAEARHGLVTKPKKTAKLGDVISVKHSTRYTNVFPELVTVLEARRLASLGDLQVRHLLPQILPAHRLWTYATGEGEKFLAISGIELCVDHSQHNIWLRIVFDRGRVRHTCKSVAELIKTSRLPGQWRQVRSISNTKSQIVLEQISALTYKHRPTDCLQALCQGLKPALWCAVAPTAPHRRYFLLVDRALGNKRLPQWAAIYVLLFYLGDLTRYRPQHFDRFLESRYGPQIESVLDECPRQFLYMMASELLQREIAPADLA